MNTKMNKRNKAKESERLSHSVHPPVRQPAKKKNPVHDGLALETAGTVWLVSPETVVYTQFYCFGFHSMKPILCVRL